MATSNRGAGRAAFNLPKVTPTKTKTQTTKTPPTKRVLTAEEKRVRNAKLISDLAKGGKDLVSGGNTPISTSANDSAPEEWVAEPAVNQSKEELTTDLEKKTPSSYLSNYNIG